MGAGVLPFCVLDKTVYFLMQTTFSGRKQGFLNDFGGGSEPAETSIQTAAREFVEETETMFLESREFLFASDLGLPFCTDVRVKAQTRVMSELIEESICKHPTWRCSRAQRVGKSKKDWETFFVEVYHRDVEPMNVLWANDNLGVFRKRRMLHWVEGKQLLGFYQSQPERLWKRVRELECAEVVIASILKDGGRSVQ
ncbi:MAG: hypothetical protein MI864_20220 [Pseudomonadales bacterium]|nr:hypothetical protein [Pseudomonadales bacterium]